MAKGEVCKTFIQRFDSARRLQSRRSHRLIPGVVVPAVLASAIGLSPTPAGARAAEVRAGVIERADSAARTVSVTYGTTQRVYDVPQSAVLVIAKRPASLEQFTTGMKVQVRSSSPGKRAVRLYDLVEANSWSWLQRVRREVTAGKVLKTDEDGILIEDADDHGTITYRVTAKTRVSIAGAEMDAKSLGEGRTVFVAPRLLPNGATMATAIADTKAAALRLRERSQPTVTGVIGAWDASARKVTLSTRAGDTRDIRLTNDCVVRRDGKDVATAALRKGVTVTVHVLRSDTREEQAHRVTIKSGSSGLMRR